MQIRLTVVDPQGPAAEPRERAASRDVLVTAPAGTALAAVASALAAAVTGDGGAAPSGGAQPVLYAGAERLDTHRCTLGEPPLTDGAVLFLGAPADPEPHPEVDDAPARLHVVAGPDAGGVHLLHGGQVRVGRSADADVPLDDPDVSRLHCAVTLSPDGRVTVADLGSTNGTVLDGARVGTRPQRLAPGALLRVGESALRLVPPGNPGVRPATTPDGEGHVRVACAHTAQTSPAAQTSQTAALSDAGGGTSSPGAPSPYGTSETYGTPAPYDDGGGTAGRAAPSGQAGGPVRPEAPRSRLRVSGAGTPAAPTGHAYGTVDWTGGAEGARGPAPTHSAPSPADHAAGSSPYVVPGQGGAPRIERHGGGFTPAVPRGGATETHGGRSGLGSFAEQQEARGPHVPPAGDAGAARDGAVPGGPELPAGARRRGGLSAWARRLTGGRGGPQEESGPDGPDGPDERAPDRAAPRAAGEPVRSPDTWPDPAALLLTALGPGPRLWERGPGHPEALTVRLGTADRTAPGDARPLAAVPVTASLREAGALGLAGPRPRLAGLARAVLAQLAALHSPETLEIVLISVDRARSERERVAEWAWLGWLPHLRPGHGQDCRLLLALDRDQATARADELLRRLEDHLADTRDAKDARGGEDTVGAAVPAPRDGGAPRPARARVDGHGDGRTGGSAGTLTVVVVDGDPGGADLRAATARLAAAGPRAGIHVLCLAETAAASPSAPVADVYEAACAAAPTFRACGAVALLSGDVATALRLLRVAPADGPDTLSPGQDRPGPVGPGTVGSVDAVSAAWAERFARALAPLRPDGGGDRAPRVSAPLPPSARLLDELGLARATPTSLMARWADAADDAGALGGRACAVLGAGPRGPVAVDLAAEGPHLLVEGPPGSGRTELLRAVVASLAAAERPDRLGIVLLDGRDTVGKAGGPGDGLRVCTDVPHVTTHLTANDPVRMREFAQSLSAELKRRAELLGRSDFTEWHTGRTMSGRIGPQRQPGGTGSGAGAGHGNGNGNGVGHGSGAGAGSVAGSGAGAATGTGTGLGTGSGSGSGDIEAPPSATLRLRPGAAARRAAEAPSPLPRLVVVVDDLDALVAPALGSPGRPAAGSVTRALEAVAREGERLGVHLVAATGPGGRTAESETVRQATLRITLDAPGSGADEPAPGRGRLSGPDGRPTPFQGGRVTGRIPRTATLRPTVVPLEWQRMGDPPTRRPVRELGNGPTDLALLASALERAAREVSAVEVPSLL
ncbi:FHA domain-containing protein [Streptomyces sp. NPDC086091]|uniref:FHA domain-containing protein n=1 Tax=Streptomyces sp. NPDC086091 TaxID=3365751 RepID=UPI0037FE99BA